MSRDSLIEAYGGAVPRYTSYPTAVQFHGGIDGAAAEEWLRGLAPGADVSVYLHMMYCRALCLYCGCNMKVTHHRETLEAYTRRVMAEIARAAAVVGGKLTARTVHLGGGTPSYVPADDLRRLWRTLSGLVELAPGAEISMEIDPRVLPEELPQLLAELGFNRASLGVQDTNPAVQEAIRRVQPHAMNRRAVDMLRAAGIRDINVDLLYGLPRQSIASLQQTVRDVMELEPARVALFGYAHVPWMKKHQKVLEEYGLPDAAARLAMFEAAGEALAAAGYVAVGIDHFCRREDTLAQALGEGGLHRNFMGYTTDAAPAMLGFGASAISQYPQGYAQNTSDVAAYMTQVDKGGMPVARGVRVLEGDKARREVIEQLLCTMRCGSDGLENLLADPAKLRGMVQEGLAEWRGGALRITPKGRPFARAVASCFDTYLVAGRHSKAV